MPKASVIIAAYNPGPFLDATVQSVIAQTFSDWELIVVDDGSQQDIGHIAGLHPAIALFRQENRGLSVARNVGIERSSGELVAFLDQDDLWLPCKLEKQVNVMDTCPEVALCYTDFERIDAQDQWLGPGFEGGAESYLGLLRGCCICVSTTLVRRSALMEVGLFDPLYVGTQDYDLYLKIARHYGVRYLPERLARYRQHGFNVSRRYAELYTEVERVMRWHILQARSRGDREAVGVATRGLRRARRVYGAQGIDRARECLRGGAWLQCLRHLSHAARLAPGFLLESLANYGKHRFARRRTQTASSQPAERPPAKISA